jgi:hypothetical protein
MQIVKGFCLGTRTFSAEPRMKRVVFILQGKFVPVLTYAMKAYGEVDV